MRASSYFPSLSEPRRRAERALSAVVQEAYTSTASPRKVDGLVKALGMAGIGKSRVSRLREELNEEVARFRDRPLDGPYPYVWVDATYLKARQDGRVASVAVVIAVGVNATTGEREVLGPSTSVPAKTGLSGPLFCARCSWTCPGTTDTRTLRIRSPRKEVWGARGNVTLSAGVQARGCPAGAFFG